MRLGLGLSLSNVRGGGAAAYDPADDAWTLWQRASYGGSPWAGTASAGTSGSRSLTEATNPPAVGTAVNGLTPTDHDGTNDRFFVHAWTDLFTLGAGTCIVLFNADAAAAETTTLGYDEAQLVGSTDGSGSWGLSVHTSGGTTQRVRAHLRDSGGYKTRVQTFTLGAWNLACMRWNSTTMTLDLNSLSTSSIACGAVASMTGNTIFGNSYNGAVFYDGKMAEILCAQTAISDAKLAQVKEYVNARYALAL